MFGLHNPMVKLAIPDAVTAISIGSIFAIGGITPFVSFADTSPACWGRWSSHRRRAPMAVCAFSQFGEWVPPPFSGGVSSAEPSIGE